MKKLLGYVPLIVLVIAFAVSAISAAPSRAVAETTETVEAESQEEEPPPTTAEEMTKSEPKSLGTYRLTAYCSCSKCCGKWAENRPKDKNGQPIVKTASGAIAKAGYTIAADTSVLPFGTKVLINGHTYEVQDVGGAIKGNRIDIYFSNHQEASDFGVQEAEVFIVETEQENEAR